MKVNVNDVVNGTIPDTIADFDEKWAQIGAEVKFLLNTYNPNVTWLNLYLSHDGDPGYNRSIQAVEQDNEVPE